MTVKASPLRAIVALRYIDGMEQGKLGDAARFAAAPEWQVDRWLNTREPLSLAAFRGRIVVAVAFQMLCPGCVAERPEEHTSELQSLMRISFTGFCLK